RRPGAGGKPHRRTGLVRARAGDHRSGGGRRTGRRRLAADGPGRRRRAGGAGARRGAAAVGAGLRRADPPPRAGPVPVTAVAGRVLALSGGVGGAKLALGLARQLEPARLAIACNTGDDFDHLGLRICPDLDTVMYTLAGRSNQQQGWGLENESWQVMAQLRAIGGETWFNLGDRDIATHLVRTGLLRQGQSLSAVTAQLCSAL